MCDANGYDPLDLQQLVFEDFADCHVELECFILSSSGLRGMDGSRSDGHFLSFVVRYPLSTIDFSELKA